MVSGLEVSPLPAVGVRQNMKKGRRVSKFRLITEFLNWDPHKYVWSSVRVYIIRTFEIVIKDSLTFLSFDWEQGRPRITVPFISELGVEDKTLDAQTVTTRPSSKDMVYLDPTLSD